MFLLFDKSYLHNNFTKKINIDSIHAIQMFFEE